MKNVIITQAFHTFLLKNIVKLINHLHTLLCMHVHMFFRKISVKVLAMR